VGADAVAGGAAGGVEDAEQGGQAMKRLARRGLLVVVLFLVSAGTAFGECAWVLWNTRTISFHSYKTAEGNIPGGSPSARHESEESFTIIGAHSTRSECEAAQAGKIDQIVKQWRKEKSEEPPTFVMGKGGGGKHTIEYTPSTNIISKSYNRVDELTFRSYERHWYRCLPDTIDPRAPKGK
jgi:hypothetical protein